MKKQLAVAGLVASLAVISASTAHAFQRTQLSTVTAQAVTGGTKVANFTLSLRDVVNTATTRTSITWSGANPGGGWKIADTLMLLNWNVTDTGGGIQVYSDNKDGTAVPQFVDPTPTDSTNADSNPAGLLLTPATGNQTSTLLPVAWSIKTSSAAVGGNLQPSDPNGGILTGANNSVQWLYLVDKQTPAIPSTNTSAFANGDPFITMVKQSGVHGAQGPTDFFSDPDKASYVYLQADFTTAAAQSTYSTNRLMVEAFIQ